MQNTYIPGVCNIGPKERRMRRYAGYAGLIVTIFLLTAEYIYGKSLLVSVGIFLAASGGAVGFLQDQLHFCARFGLSGLFNFSDDLRKQEGVEKTEYRRKDQQKALMIIFYSVLIGAVVTLASYILSKA